MLLSLNWLKDFVKIPSSIKPSDLGVALTLHTVEIDEVMEEKEKFRNIVIGKILEVKPHPNADRLSIVRVDLGASEEEIVCGAKNIKAGQLVPVALVGAKLPGGLEIKKTEIRGVVSNGMLCAEDELELGDDHDGILILDKKAKVGQEFSKHLGLDDVLFEVDNKSITNRPDLWGHFGMAREIASFLDTKFDGKIQEYSKDDIEKEVDGVDPKISVLDKTGCPRYMALKLDNIEIKDSQKHIQERLIAVGMRPINNIVDITNYVMLELGQPLHAFDSNFMDEIKIRSAKKGEKITTLDQKERELVQDDLVIADSKKPVAIAGIMGGANSEVRENTKSIIIESANFDYVRIRKTSSRLGLRTEASVRFEKGLDPKLSEIALKRALDLIKKSCQNVKVASNVIDVENYKRDIKPIKVDLDWLNKFVGAKIEGEKLLGILSSLGFKVKSKANQLIVEVPSWRSTNDITIKEDVAEEICRIFGYNNIEPTMPKTGIGASRKKISIKRAREIKNILSLESGLDEVYNYSFVGEDLLSKTDTDYSDFLRLANPVSKNATLLRQSLAHNLFLSVKNNQNRYSELAFFEIGDIYLNMPGKIKKSDLSEETLPYQEKRIGMVFAGNKENLQFARAKTAVSQLLNRYYLEPKFIKNNSLPNWADKQIAASFEIKNINSGVVGTVILQNKKVRKQLGIKKACVIVEIYFSELLGAIESAGEKIYNEFGKYPSLLRDLAFVIDEKIEYNSIREEIENFDHLIVKVDLFDVYVGDNVGKGKKSLAFNVVYSDERTLTSAEVDNVQAKLIKHLEKKFEAKLRDY